MDAVCAGGGLKVVLDHLLTSTSPRLQYEAVRLFTLWSALDTMRLAFQEIGGPARLSQVDLAIITLPDENGVPEMKICC